MQWCSRILMLALLTATACGHRAARAKRLLIPHPDDPSKKVEAYFQKPSGSGPWPTVVLLHGHQERPRRGAEDFVKWGALVAGLIAAHDPSVAGVVLISGLYDLPEFAAHATSGLPRQIVSSMIEETGGGEKALRERSTLSLAQNIRTAALILNGAKDERTDPGQTQRLADAITSHGGKARAIVYPEYGHQIPADVRDKEIEPLHR